MAQASARGMGLRITSLAAALLGVYGAAGAAENRLECIGACPPGQPVAGAHYSGTNLSANREWVVYGEGSNAVFTLQGGSVTASGGLMGAVNAADGARVYLNQVSVRTDAGNGWEAPGVRAEYGALVNVRGGSIATVGGGSYGVQSLDSGTMIELNGTDIRTTDAYSDGLRAEFGGSIRAVGLTINTTGEHAVGAMGADDGTIALRDSRITTSGVDAYGLGTESQVLSPGGVLQVSNTAIQTSGKNAHGVYLQGGSSLNMSGGSIRTTGSGAAGLRVSNGSSVALNGVEVVASGPSLLSTLSATRQQSIVVGAGSNLTRNDGRLLLVRRVAGGELGQVTLTLKSGSYAAGNIENLAADGSRESSALTIVDVQSGAQWAGLVIDDTTAIVNGSQSGQHSGFSTAGDMVLEGGSAPVTFTGVSNIGGSSSLGAGSQTTFGGATTIGQSLAVLPGGSVAFNGPLTIGESVTEGQGTALSFNAPAIIGANVQGAGGAAFTFSGPAQVGGSVQGLDGASFRFSTSAPTAIAGGLSLAGGSSLGGGSPTTPIVVIGGADAVSGAILGGNLDIGGALRMTGASLAPGNSIGTVTVGSVGALSGSTYLAEVNAKGQSDLLVVRSGNVDLAGVSLVVGQENGTGGYVLNHDYTIIKTEAGKIVGEFAAASLDESLASTLVKLDPVKYGAQATQVSLSPDADKLAAARAGLIRNQSAVLDGALSVAGRNASADAVMLMSDTGQRADALDQLSGEVHGSAVSALYSNTQLLNRTVARRMSANLGAGLLAGAPTAQAAGPAAASAMPGTAAYPLWADVVDNWSSFDAKDSAAKAKSNTAGLFIGGDAAVGAGWRVGGALGFTDGRIKADAVDSRSDVTSYTAALYGGNSWAAGKGKLNFLAGVGYTHHDIDSRRSVDVGGAQTLKADYKANTTQLFAELGYQVPVGASSSVEPYAGLAWFNNHSDSFDEDGGPAALHGSGQTDQITTFTLGLRGNTALQLGATETRLSAGLGWRHANGDVDATRKLAFIQGGGTAFTVAGSPVAREAAVLDLAAEVDVGRNAALGLAYGGQFGNGNKENTGSLYLKVRF